MKEILTDYRCGCKKLLFKGFIFVGEIEIRCRYCKRTSTVSGLNGNLSNPDRYALVTDKQGRIIKTTSSIHTILGYEAADMKDFHIFDVITSLTPKMCEEIGRILDSEIGKVIIFKGFERTKLMNKKEVQIAVRMYNSPLDGQPLFIFDINRKTPLKLRRVSLTGLRAINKK